jgi:predicted hotdog family 3-hydroxylacyl-ACP dehydratase
VSGNGNHPPVEELIAHRGTMRMLDRVVAFDKDHVVASYAIPDKAWFADDKGAMPAWIGIELMAQAIGAHVGLMAHATGKPPKRGVLLGTRQYQATRPSFTPREPLEIEARLSFRDDSGLGAYDCMIRQGGKLLATAMLKVFEPEDFESFLRDNRK